MTKQTKLKIRYEQDKQLNKSYINLFVINLFLNLLLLIGFILIISFFETNNYI